MPTLVLIRHGRSTANAAGLLAGHTPGVVLDDVGIGQAERAAARLKDVPLVALVASPLERTQQTASIIARAHEPRLKVGHEQGIVELGYGEWQGRALRDLANEPLWKVVHQSPREVCFPGGEKIVAMYERANAAVVRRNAAIAKMHGPNAVWAAVTHADIVKAILADALGVDVDGYQRLQIDTASISAVHYDSDGARVLATNTTDGDVRAWLSGI